MKITHYITFFNDKQNSVPLSEEEAKQLQNMVSMPQMIWVRGSAYNTNSISGIIKVNGRAEPKKCETCGEYKEVGHPCPKCSEPTPEQKAKNMARMDVMKRALFSWKHEDVDSPEIKNCKACDVIIESGTHYRDCAEGL